MLLSITLTPTDAVRRRAVAPPPPPPPPPVEPTVSLSGSNGDAIVSVAGLEADDSLLIEVGAPAEYAGSWEVPLAALAAGPVSLIPPVILGMPEPGQSLVVQPGLWAYDADLYAAATLAFRTSYAWRRGGISIDGATATSHTVTSLDAGTSLTVAETASAPGEPVTVMSAPVAVPAPPAAQTVAFNGTTQFVSLQGAIADRRAVAFGARMTFTRFGAAQRVFGDTGTTLANGLQLGSGNSLVVQGTPVSGNVVSNLSGGPVSAAQPDCAVAFCADLDHLGGNTRIARWLVDGNGGVWDGDRTSTTPVPAGVFLADVVGLGARQLANGTGADFAGVTFHGFVWIDDQPILDTTLRDALFEAVTTDIDPIGWRPRTLPTNGQITVGGAPRVPLIFLSGPGFGQFEVVSHADFTPSPGSGIWAIPNRGRGPSALPLIGGPLS